MRTGEAVHDQVDRMDRPARGVGELEWQGDRALGMSLHRARGVSVG